MLPGWDRLQDLRRGTPDETQAPEPSPPQTIVDNLTSAEAIDGAADRLVTARELSRISREQKMPLIEIKGLGAHVASAKKSISELRDAASGFHAESTALASELTDLTNQIKQHRADLRFEAETLGNGSGEPQNPEGGGN